VELLTKIGKIGGVNMYYDEYKIGRIREFLLQDEADDYFTDLIVFDHYVELADVRKVIQDLKDKYKDNPDTTYDCDEVFAELDKLCPFTYYWLGELDTIQY